MNKKADEVNVLLFSDDSLHIHKQLYIDYTYISNTLNLKPIRPIRNTNLATVN